MDKTMYETMDEFYKCVEQVTEFVKKNIGDQVLEMSAKDFELLQLMFRLMDTSTKLVCKQTETLHEIDRKLNVLIEKTY